MKNFAASLHLCLLPAGERAYIKLDVVTLFKSWLAARKGRMWKWLCWIIIEWTVSQTGHFLLSPFLKRISPMCFPQQVTSTLITVPSL